MALDLMEGAIDALYTYFNANIAAALDAVDAHHADSITLDDIKKWYLGNAPSAFPEWPSISLDAQPLTPTRNMKTSNLDCKYRIDIIVFVACADEQERFRRLDRYVQAIATLMEAAVATSFSYEYQYAGQVRKSPDLGQNLQGIVIPIELSAMESY